MRPNATSTPNGSEPMSVVTNICKVNAKPESRSSIMVANSMRCV